MSEPTGISRRNMMRAAAGAFVLTASGLYLPGTAEDAAAREGALVLQPRLYRKRSLLRLGRGEEARGDDDGDRLARRVGSGLSAPAPAFRSRRDARSQPPLSAWLGGRGSMRERLAAGGPGWRSDQSLYAGTPQPRRVGRRRRARRSACLRGRALGRSGGGAGGRRDRVLGEGDQVGRRAAAYTPARRDGSRTARSGCS